MTQRDPQASAPHEFSLRGWLQVTKRVKGQIADDHVTIVSAGIAFYFFLAVFPLLTAVISLYGLIVTAGEVERQLEQVAVVLPESAHRLVTEYAEHIVGSSDFALGWGLALSVLISLWSANKGTKAIFRGVNIAYNESDRRGFFVTTGLTLLFTIAGLVAAVSALAAIAFIPALGRALQLSGVVAQIASLIRWPVMAVFGMILLACVYRFAPHRDDPEWRWVSVGAVTAILLWLAASALFAIYVDNFGKLEATYGSIAAVVIFMLWLYMTAFVILLGAEINSELEHQTAVDTTTGPDEPLGSRGAWGADHVAGTAHDGSDSTSASKPRSRQG